MNHVNVEVVEEQPDTVIGKFLIKSFTALVLFDTGASHSYALQKKDTSVTFWAERIFFVILTTLL